MPKPAKLTVQVPPGFACEWYDTATPEMAAEALMIGANLYNTLKSMKASEELQALEAEKTEEISRIRAAAAAAQAAIATQLERAETERTAALERLSSALEVQRVELAAAAAADKGRVATAHAARLLEVQDELRLLKERHEALQERKKALEEGRDADIRVAEERTKALLQSTLDEKERAILRAEAALQRTDATLQTFKDLYAKQSEELKALGDIIRRKPTSSKEKGADFENLFADRLRAVFGLCERFRLVDTAHRGIGHAGDHLMGIGDHTILWEAKNYDRIVPTSEVEKFRRDVKENADVRIGVMVSRCTAITGKPTDREVEFMDDKLLIYLSNYESMSDEVLPSLMFLFRIWWHMDKGVTTEEEDSKVVAIRQIEALHKEAADARVEWRKHKSQMDDAIRWMAERVEKTEERLKATLNVLLGAATTVEVPPGIFRDVAGDARATADVQVILRHSAAAVGGSCLLNELAAAIAPEKRVSVDTAKQHIQAVLCDAAIEKAPGRKTRIIGLSLTLTHA
jgi:hypothetical protein